MAASPCPDCRDGNHQKCFGDSWDVDLDGPATCPCWSRDHQPVHVDTRTEAEVQADLAADRYEASLERSDW